MALWEDVLLVVGPQKYWIKYPLMCVCVCVALCVCVELCI